MRAVLLGSVLFLFVVSSQAIQLWVDPVVGIDGGNCSAAYPCASVAGALEWFSTSDSVLEVFLYAGTYQGENNTNVVLPEAVQTTFSPAGEGEISFDCEFASPVVFRGSTPLTIQGSVTFENCASGIQLYATPYSDTKLEIDSCNFLDCTTAIDTNNTANYIRNTNIESLKVGISSQYSFNNISSCLFTNVTHFSIHSLNSTGLTLDNTDFTRSAVTVVAQAAERTTLVTDCSWNLSPARSLELTGGLLSMSNSNISDSQEEYGNGGAIYMSSGVLDLENVKITNTASYGNGGAVYTEFTGVTISRCDFISNNAKNGGAVMIVNGQAYFSDSSFAQNNATGFGGAISLDVLEGSSEYTTQLQGAMIFSHNAATSGAAIACCGNITDATSCNMKVSYDVDILQMEENTNTDPTGSDITCQNLYSISEGDQEGNEDDNSNHEWIWWLLGVAAATILILIIAGAAFMYWKKKKTTDYYGLE